MSTAIDNDLSARIVALAVEREWPTSYVLRQCVQRGFKEFEKVVARDKPKAA